MLHVAEELRDHRFQLDGTHLLRHAEPAGAGLLAGRHRDFGMQSRYTHAFTVRLGHRSEASRSAASTSRTSAERELPALLVLVPVRAI